ncbi:MAG TPA: hypothetical protein VEK06_01835, partial [Myxococcota bacterium]|nr:hypothetical protein [Myxococcota bacterium]
MGTPMTINSIKKNSEDLLNRLNSLNEAELAELVYFHNQKYFVDNAPIISDEAFDKLVEALRFKNPGSQALLQIGVRESFGEEVVHQRPMLSLEKCYDDETLAKWAEKIHGDFVAMPKIDGVASSLLYNKDGKLIKAATRGDGRVGEDITQNVFMIESVVKALNNTLLHKIMAEEFLEVRGEMFVPLSRFNEYYAEEFANPRNLAAGALKNKDKEKSKAYGLRFLPYDVRGTNALTEVEKFKELESLGFDFMPWRHVSDLAAMLKEFRDLNDKRLSFDYEIDGVVFRANDIKDQHRLGETAHHPRFAMAYKFQTETAQTELVEVFWSV